MRDFNVTFERPWVFALLIVAAFIILFPHFRTPKNKRRSVKRILALVIRSVGIVILTFMLSEVTVSITEPVPQNEAIVVVVDCSESLDGDIDTGRGDNDMASKIGTYIDNLLSSKAANTEIQFVKFAGDAYVATSGFTKDGNVAFEEYNKSTLQGVGKTDSTDINNALRKAVTLFPEDMDAYKRVILISDGRETTGSAFEAAAELHERGIRLDTVMFDVTQEEGFTEISMLSIGVLPGHTVSAGTTIQIQVEMYSSVETDGILHFYFGDTEEDHFYYPVNVPQGRTVFPPENYHTSADDTGLKEISVRYAPKKNSDDTISANNRLSTWIKVTGKPNVLLVGAENQTRVLYDQVSSIYNTDCCTPGEFPTDMKDLLKYDEIVLMDVTARQLHADADDMIYRFVHDIGRGLLTTSGQTQGTYMSYTDEESLLADMLPVNMTLDETEHNIAIVLVIDDSSSMIPGVYNQAGADKFQPALDGAQRVIEALGENDYIGVVTFHQEATVQLELTKPENPQELIDLVQNLSAENHFNTDYSKGLNAARDMLINFDGARSKHVIFLSDGYPNQGDYSKLPTSMKNAGISVSTIALLTDNGAKNLLSNIAKEGGGKAFAIDKDEDLDNLAGIMEDLTVEAKEPQFINTEPFHPLVGEDTGVLNQVDAANMVLGGYIGSTVKSDADMPLHTNDFRPLIAEWDFGRGHVTTLMMDIAGPWCTAFFSEENNGFGLVRNLVTQSINEEVLVSGISLTTKKSDTRVHLTVNTSFHEPGQSVVVKVFDKSDFYTPYIGGDGNGSINQVFDPEMDADIAEILLNSSGDGKKYTGVFDMGEDAETNRNYYLCIVQYVNEEILDDAGNVIATEKKVHDWTVVAYNGGIPSEYDVYNLNGKDLMEGIAIRADGAQMAPEAINDLFSIVKEGVDEKFIDTMMPTALVFAILLMADILIRTISFRRKGKRRR